MTSYIKILQKLDAFCTAHLQIKKFMGEFREQMPNFSTLDERYPVVFATPVSDVEDLNTNQFTLEIYCVDIIQKDRANLNTIVSDCHLILKDMFIYYRDDNDTDLDVVGTASISFVNNFDLDYVAGAVMTITFEVAGYGSCEIPMEPIVPVTNECEPAILIVTDSEDNVLYTLTVDSGDTDTQVIADSTVTITDDSANVLHTVTVTAEGTASQVVGDSTVTIKDDSNNTLYTVSVNAEGSANQVIGDSTAVLKTTANATISTTSINAEGTANITAPDATYLVEYANGTDIQSGSIVSGGSITVTVPNPVTAPVGATLMKTGQTTSYRTGDDGDIEAGRATSFTVLASNNPFGNTNRFTDELGGQTYTNNIVIDWSTYDNATVLGWDRRINGGGANVAVQWAAAVDAAAAHTNSTFTSGWRLANRNELHSLCDSGLNAVFMNFPPFNQSNGNGFILSSTTYAPSTTLCYANIINAAGLEEIVSKTSAFEPRWIAVRTFTVTGTTLT